MAVAAALCADAARADADMDVRIEALVPDLGAYVAGAMQAYDAPGVVVAVVSGDRLVWSDGFGTASKGGAAVDVDTIFQIGSTTKAFLATTIAIAVDEGKLAWDDRVVDRYPGFQMMDPWVTQEFRVFDLLAQRSGLPGAANDALGFLGVPPEGMIRAMRHVEPASSFRSTFAYTNVTHMLAGEVVAGAMGAEDWSAVVTGEIFEPLGMTRTSLTAEAIEAADNATVGYGFDPAGSFEVPFTPLFPYDFAGAGAINSTVTDLVPWVRLQLGGGTLDGTEIVTAANLAVTKVPRIGISDRIAYAMGWVQASTANGQITWHNGGTTGYGAFIGLAQAHDLGVIVLTNLQNVGLPDAIGLWTLDRLLGNPEVDYATQMLAHATAGFEATAATFARPANPAPPPDLAPFAGAYANPSLGAAEVSVDGDRLLVAITDTGARLSLDAWDGDVLTTAIVPEGRFAAIAANLGSLPVGFAQFRAGSDGTLAGFDILLQEDGQTLRFDRR
jgi:CubicO group peptidase (beta-lactamase class C family)